jgi:hypothetical protein
MFSILVLCIPQYACLTNTRLHTLSMIIGWLNLALSDDSEDEGAMNCTVPPSETFRVCGPGGTRCG